MPEDLEDTELLRRYVESRSQEAFAELVRRRIGLVYSVALRLTRDPHRAEDVSQAVFTDLARKAASLVQRPVLAGWLYRSAHFAAVDVIRAEASRTKREREAHSMHEILGHDDGSAKDDWEKLRPVLDQVISELGERDRDAVLLRFFDGRSFGDIAARLQLTENTARMRVDRALDKLHGLLARRGVTSTATALGTLLAQQASAATAPVGLAATVTSGSLASGAAATGVLQLMISSKAMAGITGVGLALIFGATALEMRARRQTEAALAFAGKENSRLASALEGITQQSEAAEQDNARLRDQLAAVRARQTRQRETAVAATQAALAADLQQADAFMARHADVKQAFLNKNRAIAAGRYAALIRSLGLSPAQTEEFLDLVAQQTSLRFTTASGMALSFNPSANPSQLEPRLHELLGDAGFAQYRSFNPEAGRIVTELAGNLYASSSPLTASQANQLTEFIRDADLSAPKSGEAPNLPSASAYDWDAVMSRARTILSEEQLKVLATEGAARQYRAAMLVARRQANPSVSRN
jgi:RNA polymerase sigma factor (sigma-70 family)